MKDVYKYFERNFEKVMAVLLIYSESAIEKKIERNEQQLRRIKLTPQNNNAKNSNNLLNESNYFFKEAAKISFNRGTIIRGSSTNPAEINALSNNCSATNRLISGLAL